MAITRALIVDDHSLLRAGLRLLLQEMQVEVVGEASNGRQALELIRKLKPAVVLMDIEMPELNGIDATVKIRQEFPDVKVIILSGFSDESRVLSALRAGASGYLLKVATCEDLEDAVKIVGRGGTFLSPSVASHILTHSLRRGQPEGTVEPLTPRQREVLQLIAEGKNTKEVAFLLNVGIKTVETHRSQLMERLKIKDIPGLVKYAMRIGLISSNVG